ncbi:MAG: helix-turn-helix transcriptional regulator [Nitrospirota bacterium]
MNVKHFYFVEKDVQDGHYTHMGIDEILKRVREIRKAKGIKQEYLARELGMDRTNYSRKERGMIPMTVEEFLKVAKILEISPFQFFE